MRFSTIAATALAAAPAIVSAAGSMGFALGTKLPSGSCKSSSDYEADFDAISAASAAKVVRGYAASDCKFAQNILPAAKKKGFSVMLGIWPDVEESYNNDLAAIVSVASTYADTIYAVTVGSETLYRKNFTGAQLTEKIVAVKSKLPTGIKVGYADSWNKIADGTADPTIGTADIILINAFAFWQGASRDNATQVYLNDMYEAIKHIEKIAGDKMPEVWNGETGWPTAEGTDFDAAKGGKDNAAHFFQNGFCSLLDWGFNAFYFEAFDEPWKPASIGDNGKAADETTWGAFTSDRKAKFSLKC
ncbi:glycoside hydrolase family 17 protein [Pleomassaria siparia CBS 279.74]|uniref:glucan 1,3-beta-glucosidase n=1 Tax=Pleomassaria siparia CBS 279.74 TaxID=1314801 RepID=A0A6G1K195_9PLEO|nr:glycoside hydrolase family 17 protein [Pleomassaria siparia CBS 279.74]